MSKRRKTIEYCIPICHWDLEPGIRLYFKGVLYQLMDNDKLIPGSLGSIELTQRTCLFGFKPTYKTFRRFKRVLSHEMYCGLVTWHIENKIYNFQSMLDMDFPTSIMVNYPYNFNLIISYICTHRFYHVYDQLLLERAIYFLSTLPSVRKIHECDVKVDTEWTSLLRWKGIIYSSGKECGELKMIYTALLCLDGKIPTDILRYMIVPFLKLPPYK